MTTAGQKWKMMVNQQVQQSNQAEVEAARIRCEEEARFAILRIDSLIDQAFAAKQDFIVVLPSVLNFKDVACGDVDRFVESVGDNPVVALQLAGRARIVFDWCVANDLVCFVKSAGKILLGDHEYNLIAKLK